MTTGEERLEERRKRYAEECKRRYYICRALDMTKLSIELEKLERLGAPKKTIARWKDRARHLLDEILEVSDPL